MRPLQPALRRGMHTCAYGFPMHARTPRALAALRVERHFEGLVPLLVLPDPVAAGGGGGPVGDCPLLMVFRAHGEARTTPFAAVEPRRRGRVFGLWAGGFFWEAFQRRLFRAPSEMLGPVGAAESKAWATAGRVWVSVEAASGLSQQREREGYSSTRGGGRELQKRGAARRQRNADAAAVSPARRRGRGAWQSASASRSRASPAARCPARCRG